MGHDLDYYYKLVTYNHCTDKYDTSQSEDTLWEFYKILGHSGPLKPDDDGYKVSLYNLKILWNNGDTSIDPLTKYSPRIIRPNVHIIPEIMIC